MSLYRSLIARLHLLITAPTFEDQERTHLARLMNVLLWSFMAAELAGGPVLLLRREWAAAAAVFAAALTSLILTRLLHAGRLRLAVNLHLNVTAVLITSLLFMGNGIHDIAALMYPCLILVGGLLLDKKRFLLLVGVSLALLTVLVYAEVNHLIDTPFSAYTEYSDLVVMGILLVVMAVASWLLASDVQTNLQMTRQNERRLAEINQRLEAQAEAQQRSEARWRSLVENAPDLILNVAQDGTILFTNTGKKSRLGVGASIYGILTPEQQEQVRSAIDQVCRLNQTVNLEMAYYQGERESGWYSARLSPILARGQATSAMAIITDLSERRKAEEEIRLLNATLEERVALRTVELQAKNRELETLTYSVSHDLKGPLRGIDGYARLLLEDYCLGINAEARQFLVTIRQATQYMNQIINDLLAYSHLEQRPLQTSQVDLATLTQEVVAERSDEIRARQIDLQVDMPNLWVMAEWDGLRQALRNLLDNALKFLPHSTDGKIEVGGKETRQSYILWVKDNGIGFDMQYHDRIFEIFQRLNRAEEFPGTGIGLALVSKAMQRIGGRTWATSLPGKGATFYLEIPK